MFMDEAAFGRISEPSYCWAPKGERPVVPCHRVREYVYAFGAVDPIHGDDYYILAPKCNTDWTNAFLEQLSKEFPNDYILLCGDNASWHKSKTIKIPDNIRMFFIPPRTPEMNPIEQVWKEVRKRSFKNRMFDSLKKVENTLSETLTSLSKKTIKSITGRDWILSMF